MSDRAGVVLVTLSFIRSGEATLLIRVARTKDRFAGLWNGIGGHVRPGEDVRSAALREVREETGLEVERVDLRGIIHEGGLRGRAHLLFLFTADAGPDAPRSTPGSTREGELCWFEPDEIPWSSVVPDLRTLLPRLWGGEEILFGVQEFDGTDRATSLRIQP